MLSQLPPTAQTLLKAADIIRERGWKQGGYGHYGKPHCTAGALAEAAGAIIFGENCIAENRAFVEAAVVFGKGDLPKIIGWNDAPGRTAEEVIAALEAAAASVASSSVAEG